ncbi:DNA polymerase III subunit gamma/tau [Microbacterium testaceum]|uniref:DNA polymerase III subunit gamma/tau n=1 Tax=Microbacterium testaceum TaxID=2033 RepID=A0A2T7WT22_MICTE|nr:DNA polymerase III subunit gamma/tau [Microbacterium testaceum]PVE77714.1 DNA polymerase III subunit gamma/tau [Microbacterium testaceum]
MSTPRDDDALSWGGDDDPTLDVGEKRAPGRADEPAVPGRTAEPVQPEPLQPDTPEPLQPVATSAAAPAERHPEPSTPAERDEPGTESDADAAHSAPLGNVGLVGIGMVAATFVLFAVGWLIAGLQLRGLGLPIPDVTLVSLTIAAALAPMVWFVAVLALTRSWRTWQRFLLLILGIVLLVPWPFLSLGVFA